MKEMEGAEHPFYECVILTPVAQPYRSGQDPQVPPPAPLPVAPRRPLQHTPPMGLWALLGLASLG